MAMHDNIIVNADNSLGIKMGAYRTKCFNNGLDSYVITKDNKIRLDLISSPGGYVDEVPETLPSYVYNIYGCIVIYNEFNKYYLLVNNDYIEKIVSMEVYDAYNLNTDYIKYLDAKADVVSDGINNVLEKYINSSIDQYKLTDMKYGIEEVLLNNDFKFKHVRLVYLDTKLYVDYVKNNTEPVFII